MGENDISSIRTFWKFSEIDLGSEFFFAEIVSGSYFMTTWFYASETKSLIKLMKFKITADCCMSRMWNHRWNSNYLWRILKLWGASLFAEVDKHVDAYYWIFALIDDIRKNDTDFERINKSRNFSLVPKHKPNNLNGRRKLFKYLRLWRRVDVNC